MMTRKLTRTAGFAKTAAMKGDFVKNRTLRAAPLAMLGAVAVGGCVQVTAPDKPIVIELNVNIRQEVIYRLAADAGNTIDQNEDIF